MKVLSVHILRLGVLLLNVNHAAGQSVDTLQVNDLNQKARELLNENQFEESLKTITEAGKAAEKINWDEGLLKVYVTKSSVQNIYNKHYDAIATGLKGLELAQKLNNEYYEVLFYRSLANNHDMLDNYEEAIPYYQKCIDSGEKVPQAKLTQGHCYVEMGDAYRLHYKKPKEARELIEKGIAIYKQSDPSTLGYAYDCLGEALTDLKLYDDAEKTFKESLKIYETNGEDYLIPELLFHTANMYLVKKSHPQAISTAKEGLRKSREMKTIYGESEAHKVLYEAYKQTSRPELALEHFEDYIILRDSLTKANIDNHFDQIRTEAKLRKQESELSELQLEQQQSTLRNQQIIVLMLFVLFALAAVLANYFRRLNKKLQAKNTMISEALLSGQATERQRLSREIRDHIGANISSVLWTLDLLDTSKLSSDFQKTLHSLKGSLSAAYDRVNLLSKNIVPDELETAGLAESLNRLIRKFNETEKADYKIDIPENFKGTEPKIEFEIYNIVMELLQLCRKLKCSEARFSLDLTGRRIKLTLEAQDYGDLIKSEDLLLQQIGIRVESLNGTMSLSQEGNTNMEIRFRIPN